jgi:DNA repair exonuclease SbcCD ATPase subunit
MILFESVSYRNLLSTGNNWTEVPLNEYHSTLIVGENGAGKSTLIDALSFALYNRPFRSVNKNQLINSINGKGLEVIVKFTIGKNKYRVRRGIKPNIFEIFENDKIIKAPSGPRDHQDTLENKILKLNFKAFSQIVVIGSANFTPFMQLTKADRREVIEDLLNIQVFSTMNVLLKSKIQANKTALSDVEYQIALCDQKIELHKKHMASLKQNNQGHIDTKTEKYQQHGKMIELYQIAIFQFEEKIAELETTITDTESVTKKLQTINTLRKSLTDKNTAISKEVNFFTDHDNCPTCKQDIDADFKNHTITSRNDKVKEIADALAQLEVQFQEATIRQNDIQSVQAAIQQNRIEISERQSNINVWQKYNTELRKEIDLLEAHTARVDSDQTDLKEFQKQHKKSQTLKEDLIKQRATFDVASALLKDGGIKTQIIKQYIPIINKLINKYLASMDFFVAFELDENFNEVIKSRFRDDFSYESFSEGEKARLNIALLFTWRAIAKLRNSGNTSLLIMDEVFDGSLDGQGSDELLKIFGSLAADTNVFVISHKKDAFIERFDNVLKFEKCKNFSRLAEMG